MHVDPERLSREQAREMRDRMVAVGSSWPYTSQFNHTPFQAGALGGEDNPV